MSNDPQKEIKAENGASESVESSSEKVDAAGDVGIKKRAQFENGDYRQFTFDNPVLTDNIEYNQMVRVLGLDASEEASYRNEIGEIAERVYTWLGTTDDVEVFKFVKQLLRRLPTGNRIMNLKHQLKIMYETKED